jgi:hypothetical protein
LTSGTGSQSIAFWKWVADKGLVKKPTADARRSALSEVLETTENLNTDVRTLDLEETLTRFENRRAGRYSPATLNAYKKRFRLSILDYIAWLEKPDGWRPNIKARAPRSTKVKQRGIAAAAGGTVAPAADLSAPVSRTVAGADASRLGVTHGASNARLIDYPFPVRDGVIAVLSLPSDLTEAESLRLAAFVSAVAIPDPALF